MIDYQPVPIDRGQVAQRLVHYRGGRGGLASVRGRVSHREYYHDVVNTPFWVLEEDLELFRLLADFDVTDERIPGRAEQQQLEQTARLEALEQQLAALQSPATPTVRPPKRGGRHRYADGVLRRALHLRHHVSKRWTNDQIARLIYGDGYEDRSGPANAISKMLSGARLRFPRHEEHCPLCESGDDSAPPPKT